MLANFSMGRAHVYLRNWNHGISNSYMWLSRFTVMSEIRMLAKLRWIHHKSCSNYLLLEGRIRSVFSPGQMENVC